MNLKGRMSKYLISSIAFMFLFTGDRCFNSNNSSVQKKSASAIQVEADISISSSSNNNATGCKYLSRSQISISLDDAKV